MGWFNRNSADLLNARLYVGLRLVETIYLSARNKVSGKKTTVDKRKQGSKDRYLEIKRG